MSINVKLVDKKGDARIIKINLSDIIGDKKRELNQPNGIWKHEGEILKDEKNFSDYDVEEFDQIITNIRHQGGTNNK